jgi:sugar phosphate isomerase/epimerase
MKSAVTASLIPEAKGGPFILWDDLPTACATAARLGFDAIEIFPPSPQAVTPEIVRPLLDQHKLELAAIGTGGGWVAHRWHFSHPDPAIRTAARNFARSMVEAAAALGAPAIVGSMQGRFEGDVSREQALHWVADALEELAEFAGNRGQTLFYEPLNRYETNIFNRLGDTVEFLQSLRAKNIRILADMFHMSIEEISIADALRAAGPMIGHFHFADSNRRAIGWGHTDVTPIVQALKDIGYQGYISGEALAIPNPEAAAAQTIASFRKFFPR